MTNSTPPTQSGLATTELEPVQATEPAAPPVPEAPVGDAEPAAPPAEPEVSTRGGLPVVPAVTVGTTSTIAAMSATGLVAGGPAALLAAGALFLVPVAAAAMVRAKPVGTLRRDPARGAQRSGGVPPQRSAGRLLGSLGSAGARRGAGSGTGGGAARRAAGTGGALRQKAAAVRQVRRASAAEAAGKGRTTTAADTTRARRQLADARRAERQQQRRSPAPGSGARQGAAGGLGRLFKGTAPKSGGTRPQTGRGGTQGGSAGRGGAAGRLWRAGRGAAAQTLARARRSSGGTGGTGAAPKGKTAPKSQGEPRGFLATRRATYRAARDRIRDQWRAQKRGRIEERARTHARRNALRRSAARFHGRRALAALAATPLGVLALALWPLAKLLRIQPPRWGRAVWRKLCRAAQEERVARDIAAYQDHDQAEADRARWQRQAQTPPGIDRARPGDAPVPTTQEAAVSDINSGTGFDFRDAAGQMLEQAQRAEPGGMMQVLAQVETLPEALAAIAETFASVAAVMSPENMPLAPEVNEALGDLHKQLLLCVDAAEAVGETFQVCHEADIARHTDGRTAEEMWDVTRQED